MKHYTLLILLCALTLTSCKKNKTKEATPLPQPIATTEEVRDSTLWGHLGEDTGMSALQFITDDNDTLELFRTNQYTGEDGKLLGGVRNATDRFAITTTPDGETMLTAINATQLDEVWRAADRHPYDGWKLWNGHILLSSQQQQEIGIVNRIDTMDILLLEQDSLVIRSHVGQTITFRKDQKITTSK